MPELLNCFSPADAAKQKIKCPLEPSKIYGTKQAVNLFWCHQDLMCHSISEIGESQAMIEAVKHIYINDIHEINTETDHMHMDPEIWYQQHTLNSDAHHLNCSMIDIVQKYMRGDATRMETYTDLGALV